MNQGWIKLHRKITEWEWYTETNTFAVFMHLILTCNFKPTKWRGIELQPGETVKAITTLAEETNLSVQTIRTAIKRLKSTRELTQRQHGKHRILKLKSYDAYQLANTDSNNELTSKQHRFNIESTLDKECKERKNEKNEKKYTSDSDEYRLAALLIGKIIENNPTHKFTSLSEKDLETQTHKYSAEVDRMIRLDSRTPGQIEFLIDWCQQDDFWQGNILSMKKLRQKFDP